MDREYDIFERISGGLIWRETVASHSEALSKLDALGAGSSHEFIVMHIPTKKVIATVNTPAS